MPMFQIRQGSTIDFTVRARDIDHAADIAARRLYGRTRVARRVTGTNGMSGMFQAYRSEPGGGLNSVGSTFHVGNA